eukprot:741762_1
MGATCEPCPNNELYIAEPTQRKRALKCSKSPSVESDESKDHFPLSDTPSSEAIYNRYHGDPFTQSNSYITLKKEMDLNQAYSDTTADSHSNADISPMNTVRLHDSATEILNVNVEAAQEPLHSKPTIHSWNTQKCLDITHDILSEMSQSMGTKQQQLVVYSGWMDKKQSSAPYSWLKRWVVVKDGSILWSEWQMAVQHQVDDKEKRRWNKCIYLGRNGITVTVVKSKRNRRFKLITPKREFLFRTRDKSERDEWVNTLKQ